MTEQMTFTESEAKSLADFTNFVYTKGEWKLSSAEAFALAKHFRFMQELQTKIDAHIMEVTKIVAPPKKAKK